MHERFWSGPADERRLCAALTSAWAIAPGRMAMHVGDLTWGLYQNTVFDPCTAIRIWEDPHGAILGFVWATTAFTFTLQPQPDHAGDDVLLEAMLAWCDVTARQWYAAHPAEEASVRLGMAEDDRRCQELARRHGFAEEGDWMVVMAQSLVREPAPADLPPGWTLRAVGGEEEWAARVDLHRAVWQSSRVTLDAYRQLRAAAGYWPELDLVAVAPDGTFGAYCICWLDEANRVGQFEPVGTHPDWQRRGLAKAVIAEGVRRLHGLGAERAFVCALSDNPASVALYQSSGFAPATRELTFHKLLTGAD